MKGQSYHEIYATSLEGFFQDEEYVFEQKLDGVRVLIHVEQEGITFRGTAGDEINFAAAKMWFEGLRAQLEGVGPCIIDGELIISTGDFWAFDLPWLWDPIPLLTVTVNEPFQIRRRELERLVWDIGAPSIRCVPEAHTEAEKRALWEATLTGGQEGIVMKRVNHPYEPGVRTLGVLKAKHVKTFDCVVMERPGPTQARLGMFQQGELVQIGSCSMIGKPDAQVGQVVEVKALYVTTSMCLYQPRLERIREDKAPEECQYQQLVPAIVNRAVVGA